MKVLDDLERYTPDYLEWKESSTFLPEFSNLLSYDPQEKGEHGYTRAQCEDIGLPFKPKKPEVEGETLEQEVAFDWRYCLRVVDFYTIWEVQELKGKRGFILWRGDKSGLICKGSYKKVRQFYIDFKEAQTNIENLKSHLGVKIDG